MVIQTRDDKALSIDAIRTIYDLWQVDAGRARWMGGTSAGALLREGYGFDWWPGDFKVSVRVFGPHPELDFPLYRLSVQTDFLRDVDITTPAFAQNISDLNRTGLSFAICAHPETAMESLQKSDFAGELGLDFKSSRVWLASTAYMHEDTKDWLPRTFGGLALFQPIEAQFRADLAMLRLGGKRDCSSPPGGARPPSPDDILGVESLVASYGGQPSKWIETGEFERIVERWGRSDSGFGDAGKGWLAIETPFGGDTAMVRLDADQPHPRLGHGLLATMAIPYRYRAEDITARLAMELNFMEVTHWVKIGVPFIGNWSVEQRDSTENPVFIPMFSCFIPNMMHRAGLAENLVLYLMGRARWCREILQPGRTDLSMHEILEQRLRKSRGADTAAPVRSPGLAGHASRLLKRFGLSKKPPSRDG